VKLVCAIMAAIGLALGLVATASAAANIGQASCEGVGVSNSAPGTIAGEFDIPAREVAGPNSDFSASFFAHLRKDLGAEFGLPPGEITSTDAQHHLDDPNAEPADCFPEE